MSAARSKQVESQQKYIIFSADTSNEFDRKKAEAKSEILQFAKPGDWLTFSRGYSVHSSSINHGRFDLFSEEQPYWGELKKIFASFEVTHI